MALLFYLLSNTRRKLVSFSFVFQQILRGVYGVWRREKEKKDGSRNVIMITKAAMRRFFLSCQGYNFKMNLFKEKI
jgi:hypothetical protein